ncbi:MAG TPA: dienelactone hydrolase family protein [Stellaceae bacterium]
MNAARKDSPLLIRSILAAVVAAGLALPPSAARAQTLARLEIHPLSTVTLSGDQFLIGDKNGKPARLAGELRIPKPGTERLPAVVLVHGSGGLGASADRWAQELNGIGVAVFILDSFTGRGITSTINDQSQLNSLAMMVDAYRALALLAEHPRIDPNRIAIMGFSKGAIAAVYSSNERFRQMYAPGTLRFAAHIGLYTPCNVTYRDDTRTTGKPIRLFHGIADDYVSIVPCRAYVERLKAAGADATLTEFPGAYHAYDNFMIAQPIKFPEGQTTRNCFLEERAHGQIFNSKTGKPYDLGDACVEKGPQVAYNAAAHQATVQGVKDFLKARFDLK